LPSALPGFDVALEVFSMEIPELVVDLKAKNADEAWTERVELGASLYVDKKLSKGKNSFG
jgi:cytochrome c peroxidase